MKIGIHSSKGFSKRWIDYCERQNIPHKLVDCYRSDITDELTDCDALMWHFSHDNYRDILFARQLIFALEAAGKKVFPDSSTCWHFDDKVGQKYLLEAIGAPLVPSITFYDKIEAIQWANQTSYPKIFKLRSGGGSANVLMVRNENQAVHLIRKAFGKGFSKFNRTDYLKEKIRKYKTGKANALDILKGIGRLIIPTDMERMMNREKGYVYFQDFIPNNDSDTRIIVIGDRAFGIKRGVRKDDFRASGSGNIFYDKENIDTRCIEIAFDINRKLKAQCLAYDFIFNNNEPLIVEISFGFAVKAYDSCPGYWDKKLNWHQGKFISQEWMVDLILANISK